MNNTVSVIIPCYNCEGIIDRAVQSVFNQTHIDWELILVNNNSVDRTLDKLLDYQKKHSEKISVCEEGKIGAPAARNRGLQMAKGDWVQFLDADDELMPEKLNKQLELVRSRQVDFVVGRFYRVFNFKGKRLCFLKPIIASEWEGLISGKLGITSSNLWNRNALNGVDGWDESLVSSQEYDLMFRLLKDKKKAIFDVMAPLTNVYFESGSITRNSDKEKNEQILYQYIKLRKDIKAHLINESLYGKTLERLFSNTLYAYLLDKKDLIDVDFERIIRENEISISWNDKFFIELRHVVKSMISKG